MQARLYSTVKQNLTEIYDQVSGKNLALSPVAKPEELLGTFSAREFTAPNGRKWIIVDAPRKSVRVDAQTLTQETRVNIFRVEVV